MVGLLIGALVLVLAILMAYQRYVAGKKPVQHLCDYCGHMVTAVSDCHHAPVRERFLHGTCLECKQDCRLVCARCKNPLRENRAANVIGRRSLATEPMSGPPAAQTPTK